ncbi:hypothetical protein Pd630_LPD01615 [Rhodococcus opacus PD630]|nr:hypothetical protein Pd630_LPD01615 [Rhodococcus opacus PD630]
MCIVQWAIRRGRPRSPTAPSTERHPAVRDRRTTASTGSGGHEPALPPGRRRSRRGRCSRKRAPALK